MAQNYCEGVETNLKCKTLTGNGSQTNGKTECNVFVFDRFLCSRFKMVS